MLVAGTASEAGKSAVTAGFCRWLARRGVKVAPFKAQNMSLNSVVTSGRREIGRAQAMQAAAAGIEPEAAMNPVLLKPGSDRHQPGHVFGKPVAEADAHSYRRAEARLADTVLACLTGLADRYDVVICEGAGSPAEINLRDARPGQHGPGPRGRPAGDRGRRHRPGRGARRHFRHARAAQPRRPALVAGFVVNKFRGDAALLQPGLDGCASLTGRPALGVLPWTAGLWLDAEDSLGLRAGPAARPCRRRRRRAAGRGGPAAPDVSNFTDVDPLAAEPGVTSGS